MQAPDASQEARATASRGTSARITLHLIFFAALIGAGIWIAHQAVVAPRSIGPIQINIEAAAMYWFALLVYGSVCLVLYYPLRRQAWWALFIGHAMAVVIALGGTATVVTLGYRNIPEAYDIPAESAGMSKSTPGTDDPSVQPLPLPPPVGSPDTAGQQ